MTLADQIIEHGPWTRSDSIPGHLRIMMSDGLNELRDELLELRRLRQAAHAFIDRVPGTESDFWDETDCANFETLADLVRRADQHTQDCP